MAKKKPQYPNRRRNNIITALVCLVLVAALATAVTYQVMANDYVIKVDGKSVNTKEYKLSLAISMANYRTYAIDYGMGWTSQIGENGETFTDLARNDALNMIVNQKVIEKECKNRGLTISEEQKTDAKESFESFWNGENGVGVITKAQKEEIGMKDAEVLKFFENSMLGDVLYEDITKEYDFEGSEEEQQKAKEYYEQYLVDNKTKIIDYNINYIITDNRDNADLAQLRAARGEDFYSLIEEYEYAGGAIVPNEEVGESSEISEEPNEVDEEPSEVVGESEEAVDETGEIVDEHEGHDHADGEEIEETNAEEETEPQEDPRKQPVPASSVTELAKVIDQIYEMTEGQVSEVIEIVVTEANEETGDPAVYQYAVVKLDNIVLPDYEALEVEQTEAYQKSVKDTMVNTIISGLMETFNIGDPNYDKINEVDASKLQ